MVKRLKKNKGFTLVELVVVIVILAILVGVTISGIFIYVRQSRIATDLDTASAIQSACSVLEVDEDVIDTIQVRGTAKITWSEHVENKDIRTDGAVANNVKEVSDVVKKLFPDGLPAPKIAGKFILAVKCDDEGDVTVTCKAYKTKDLWVVSSSDELKEE